ncbi:unnamed protein product [Lymnaea stagnalis]|uniref:Phosphatidylinositol N-acetylglucosaminyltransferase subunit H conserved domain-containing protein n=1 Tax=Lymnaea stagnalis TaxID=6523 RepID=A0AAV2H2Z7_LYMST
MVLEMKHRDLGDRGSEFTFVHPPLKNRFLFVLLLIITMLLAFLSGLHLLDKGLLATLCLVLGVTLMVKLYLKIHSENLLILPSLGLQLETQYYLGHKHTHFIHLTHIKDVIINEAVTMHSIMHYLLVLLKGKQSDQVKALQPVFSHSWPSLAHLKLVYKAAQEKLIKSHRR